MTIPFSGTVTITEGENSLTIDAVDEASNSTGVVWTVTLDTEAPVLSVTAPQDGAVTSETSITVSGTAIDATPVSVTVNGTQLPVDGSGTFSAPYRWPRVRIRLP